MGEIFLSHLAHRLKHPQKSILLMGNSWKLSQEGKSEGESEGGEGKVGPSYFLSFLNVFLKV